MIWYLKILATYLHPKWHLTKVSRTWGLDESSTTTAPSFGGGLQRLTITHNNIERVWERAATKPRKRKIRRGRWNY